MGSTVTRGFSGLLHRLVSRGISHQFHDKTHLRLSEICVRFQLKVSNFFFVAKSLELPLLLEIFQFISKSTQLYPQFVLLGI